MLNYYLDSLSRTPAVQFRRHRAAPKKRTVTPHSLWSDCAWANAHIATQSTHCSHCHRPEIWGYQPQSTSTLAYVTDPRHFPRYVKHRWPGGIPRTSAASATGAADVGGPEDLAAAVESAQEQLRVAATEVATLPNGAYKSTATCRLSDQISLVRHLKNAHHAETSRRGKCRLKHKTCSHDDGGAKTQQLNLTSDACWRLDRCLHS